MEIEKEELGGRAATHDTERLMGRFRSGATSGILGRKLGTSSRRGVAPRKRRHPGLPGPAPPAPQRGRRDLRR